jgi:hypothetical protein
LAREQSALFPLQQPREDPDSGTLAQSRWTRGPHLKPSHKTGCPHFTRTFFRTGQDALDIGILVGYVWAPQESVAST